MIPAPIFSPFVILAMYALMIATPLWLIWTIRLALSPTARGRLRRWRAAIYLLMTCASVFALWVAYDIWRMSAEIYAESNLVLPSDRRIGSIDMPAGTKLQFELDNQPEAFTRAEFPRPVRIGGVDALIAERYLRIETDDSYRQTGFTPQNIRMTGRGNSVQAGWICDAAHVIRLATNSDGSVGAFERCIAAEGNKIGDAPLPKGSEIIATDGTTYTDGSVDADRWLIYLPPDLTIAAGDGTLVSGRIRLGADRKVFGTQPQ